MKKADKLGYELIAMIISNKNDDEIQLIKFIKDNKFNVNIRDGVDNTPLILCASRSYSKTIESLLKAKADPNLANMYGIKPLYWSLYDADIESAKLLMEYGANFDNIPHMYGETAIFAMQKLYRINDRMELSLFLLNKMNKLDEVETFKQRLQVAIDKLENGNNNHQKSEHYKIYNKHFIELRKHVDSYLLNLKLENNLPENKTNTNKTKI